MNKGREIQQKEEKEEEQFDIHPPRMCAYVTDANGTDEWWKGGVESGTQNTNQIKRLTTKKMTEVESILTSTVMLWRREKINKILLQMNKNEWMELGQWGHV